MASGGGIARSGSPGNYTYSPIAGRARMPVNYVSFYDALRFANWLHNGQGHGDTETGAYTLAGGTPIPSNEPLTRNAGADVFIPTDDEWYKAAYYSTARRRYFDYPAGTNTAIVCSLPGAAPNAANCGAAVGDLTDVGSYTGSASPNGTLDQGGTSSSGRTRSPSSRTARSGAAMSPAPRSGSRRLAASTRIPGTRAPSSGSAWRAPLLRRGGHTLARLRSCGDVL